MPLFVSQLLNTLVDAELELIRMLDDIANIKFGELFVGGDDSLDVDFQ